MNLYCCLLVTWYQQLDFDSVFNLPDSKIVAICVNITSPTKNALEAYYHQQRNAIYYSDNYVPDVCMNM